MPPAVGHGWRRKVSAFKSGACEYDTPGGPGRTGPAARRAAAIRKALRAAGDGRATRLDQLAAHRAGAGQLPRQAQSAGVEPPHGEAADWPTSRGSRKAKLSRRGLAVKPVCPGHLAPTIRHCGGSSPASRSRVTAQAIADITGRHCGPAVS